MLPALAARRVAAEAREKAAADWLLGGGPWEGAFPDLADVPLGDPDVLRVRLAALGARGVTRAAERGAPAPADLTDPEVDAWRAAVADTTAAEERADAAEVRFLSGVVAGLERAPGLTDGSVARWEADLPPLPADPSAPVPADVLAAHEGAQELRTWRRAAWHTMTRPGDTELAGLVTKALDAQPAEPADDFRDRLLRVMPLLDQALAWRAAASIALTEIDEGELNLTQPQIGETAAPPSEPEIVPESPAEEWTGQVASWRAELDRLRREFEDAELRTSLDRARQPQRDATYLSLRDLVGELHTAVIENHARAPADETHATVELLIEAKEWRRHARALASGAAREVGRHAFIQEVLDETKEIPAVWAYHLERTARRLNALPALLMDLTALYAFLTGSLLFFASLVGWWFLRSTVPGALAAAIDRLDEPDAHGPRWSRLAAVLSAWLERPGDYRRLSPRAALLVRRLVDVGGACALLWWTRHETPVVHFTVSLVVAIAVWRTWPLVVDLVLATADDHRPALWIVAPGTLSRVRTFAAWLVGWWLLTACADVLLLEVLAADKWTQLADTVAGFFGIGIVCVGLWMWEPDIRAGLARLHPTRIVGRLAAPGGRLTRIPRAALALVLLALFHIGRLTGEIVATSRRLRWVGGAVARRQLARGTELRPLDPAMRTRIENLDHGVAPKVRAAVGRVITAHGRWKGERSGMAAVTAERGAGLALLPDLLQSALENVRRAHVPQRICDVPHAREWLAKALGLPDRDEGFVNALQRLPPSSIVVTDAHLLFVRRAGGFDALRWVLDAMQATSEEHFWVWCTDAHTWAFLQDTPGAVDLGNFRDRIHVEPMQPEELGAWLLDPVTAAGLRASFSALVRGGADGVDPPAEVRARRFYLRVLEDLSQGRPSIARSLWHASLRSGGDGAIEHAVPVLPQAAIVDTLADEDLFVLAALVTHAGLDINALSDVLNRPATRVQSACRRLEGRGVLVGDEQGTWFDVADIVHPTVVRVLRQRAFLDTI